MIHPGANDTSPFTILDILESSGADISRTVMAHLDRTILSDEIVLQLARRGVWLEYDLFGTEVSHCQVSTYISHASHSATSIQTNSGLTNFILLILRRILISSAFVK